MLREPEPWLCDKATEGEQIRVCLCKCTGVCVCCACVRRTSE